MKSREHIQNMTSANMESDNTPDQTTKQSILDKIPQQLRPQGKMQYSFFPGSAFVDGGGRWVSPGLSWNVGDFRRSADGVESVWDSYCSALLLER
ncbi:MAG TPA: hypothetical protein PKA96_03090 [Candidatus Paceibacterota bacterium]|nr:hypothetical protein [Candidatus Paceibacterota bacterium]